MDRTFADCLRVGHGYDVHALAPGLRLRLCGVDLEHDRGCVAHSDGDVAVHALCDALLGAAALGDIGLHFPDTAAEYAGIDSMVLLERCMELLAGEGFGVVNADVTIAMQRRCFSCVGQGDHDRTARLRRPRGGGGGQCRGVDSPAEMTAA